MQIFFYQINSIMLIDRSFLVEGIFIDRSFLVGDILIDYLIDFVWLKIYLSFPNDRVYIDSFFLFKVFLLNGEIVP